MTPFDGLHFANKGLTYVETIHLPQPSDRRRFRRGVDRTAACGGSSSTTSTRLHHVLEGVPADAFRDHFLVTASDLVLGAERLGIERPSCTDDDEFFEHVVELRRDGTISVPFSPTFSEGLEDTDALEVGLGFRPCNVEAVASLNHLVDVYAVDLGDDDIRTNIESDPDWSSKLDVSTVGEATVFDWGSEGWNLEIESLAHRLGYGGRASLTNGVLTRLVSRGADGFALPVRESVTDIPAVDAVLGVAPDAHAVALVARPSAVGSLEVLVPTAKALDDFEDRLEEQVEDDSLQAYGPLLLAEVHQDGATYAVAVLAHATNEDARENRDRLERILNSGKSVFGPAWKDLLVLSSVEVDDKHVIARLDPAGEETAFIIALGSVVNQESLFGAS